MHPIVLHQIADDRVIERRRGDRHYRPVRRRPPTGVAARVRTGIGGLLISVGTRVAGPRPVPVGLRRTPT